jgi:ABC-type glutathione transport system ATPase component
MDGSAVCVRRSSSPARRAVHTDVTDRVFEVEHLELTYTGHLAHTSSPVLTDVSFGLERGRALALAGSPGSGRTWRTTTRSLAFEPRQLRRRVALVMHAPVLFEGTVADNLRLRPAGAAGDFSEVRLRRALAEVGLDPRRLEQETTTLSGGEKQRVTIARALLRDPHALLRDEPASPLQPPTALFVVATLASLRKARRMGIVAVTHQPELVRRLGGTLLYLVMGRVQTVESVQRGARGHRT